MAVAEVAQRGEPAVRRHDVATLPEDRLDDDRGHLLGRDDPLHQEALDVVDRREALLVAPRRHLHVAAVAVVGVQHAGQERTEPGAVLRLRRRERHAAVGAAVERAVERDHVLAAGGPPRQLDPRLHRLGARVGEEGPDAAGHRRDLREPLRDLGVDRQVEVGGGVVDQLRRLPLDRLHHRGVAVPRRRDRDPRVHVEEDVAVHVLDHRSGPTRRDERIGPRERGRRRPPVPLEHLPGLRPGQLRDQLGGLGPREAPVRLGSLLDHRPGLLPQVLRHVVGTATGLAGRARPLPAAERLDARPGARSWRPPAGSRTRRRPGSCRASPRSPCGPC